MSKINWWQGGVIYQIYPRSFYDSNGDGIGDLAGITEKLDYVADLGVDAIWLSPFFQSPMKDFGYDVSDYRAIAPQFGNLDDFKILLKKAHDLGLKVIIDQVISHTSDQHQWFQESRTSQSNEKADWYVWADPKADGTAPTNWLSIFGGSAWQFETKRQQYYLHNFLSSQPDLNFHNPEVRAQLLSDMRFWLEMGVDGFRLDTVNFYYHDPYLRDNPPWVPDADPVDGVPAANPYSRQSHIYDKTRPENLDFLRDLRQLMDEFPDRTLVGEIGADNALKVMGEYTSGHDKLHMAYGFDLLEGPLEGTYIHQTLERVQTWLGDGWPSWSVGNHDVARVASRWQADPAETEAEKAARLRLIPSFYMSLRGSPCLYQGEELGLPEADIPYDLLQDPYGIEMWPEFKGRDGCRTPFPWKGNNHGGFSTEVQSWLPMAASHLPLAVDQQADAGSLHEYYRQWLRLRRHYPALQWGDLILLPQSHPDIVAYYRVSGAQKILCVFHMAKGKCDWDCPDDLDPATLKPLSDHAQQGVWQGKQLHLSGWGYYLAEF